MPSLPPQRGNNYPLQWIHIDDFSPGGYDASNISIEDPINSAPLGSCQLRNTFSCSSIPGGQLAPLPKLVSSLPVSTIGGIPGASPLALIAGFIATPYLNNGGSEIVTVLEADNGVNHFVAASSYNASTTAVNTITGPTITSGTVAGFFGAPYPAYTRMNTTGGGTIPPPGPVLVFPTAVSTDARGVDGHLWVYPSLAAPTTFVADDLISGVAATPPSSITGQVITYGNRVICIAGVNYQWPTGGGVNTNENFNYTDPPESNVYGNQQTIMAVEQPWGYGAWGTVSVGELLLVKKVGGAVILNGDINVPTSIIRMPEIQSTGNIVGQAYPTSTGLVYCSENRGAWLWNGGNNTQKISEHIADDFFDLEHNVVATNNYGFNVFRWQKWMLFSNNVAMDTTTNGWWQWFPKKGVNPGPLTGQNIWWYANLDFGNKLAVSPLVATSNSDPWFSIFDNTVPSPYYQWQSLPINAGSPDRVLDVRQVVVYASDPTNTGTATIGIAIGSFSGTTSAGSNPIGINPTPLRFNVGAQGVDRIVLTLTANNPTSNGSAPIIHSIDIGYIDRAGVPVAD